MESMDNVRERIAALEQQMNVMRAPTRTVERRLRWWRGLVCAVMLLGLVGLARSSQAADFTCAAGDVACLINAINQANANGEANTIILEAGTYTLTAVDHTTDEPTGLPVTSTLTIRGAGADTTILQCAPCGVTVVHVAAAGVLTLEGLTVRDGGGFQQLRHPIYYPQYYRWKHRL